MDKPKPYTKSKPGVIDLTKPRPVVPSSPPVEGPGVGSPKTQDPKPQAPAPAPAKPSKPGLGSAAAIVLLLLCWLLGSFTASAQYTTNPPSVLTNVAASFTTNAPHALLVGGTNWPPAPTFTNFVDNSATFTLSGICWTNNNTNLSAVPGTIEVWNANLPAAWAATPTNWALVQQIALTTSVTNQTTALTNASLQSHVWAKLRYAFGNYRSAFSTVRTNYLAP